MIFETMACKLALEERDYCSGLLRQGVTRKGRFGLKYLVSVTAPLALEIHEKKFEANGISGSKAYS